MTPTEIRSLRRNLGFTQAQLAARLGLSTRQVVRLEAGDSQLQGAAKKALLDLRGPDAGNGSGLLIF